MTGDLSLHDLGLVEHQDSRLDGDHARTVAATLDVSVPADGSLPLLWHWAYFNPVVPSADLGPDGHPLRHGDLLVDHPRRMWVGGQVTSAGSIRLDTPATRQTRLVSHERKSGSTGQLLLVVLEHTIRQLGAIVLTERQDVIYRAAAGATSAPGPAVRVTPEGANWIETVTPTRPLLFRFSAVTFNSHRIHFDREYAVDQEGYPDVVVHGPLTATMLAMSAAHRLGRVLTSFDFRAQAPLFVDQPITISGHTSGDTVTLAATRFDGATAMTATAR
jgi:3-methylfumaryl-CoA hydratase